MKIQQINDSTDDIEFLKEDLLDYINLDLANMQANGPVVDEEIFNDQTKYFIHPNDNLVVLKNSNKIPDNYEIPDISNYRDEILNYVPQYYFIWDLPQDLSSFDVDTNPELNQYPYKIYYRLELINDNNKVYVIEDNLNHEIFTDGLYGYINAEISIEKEYPTYSDGDIYIPNHVNNTLETITQINDELYYWRIVAQNYSSYNNGNILEDDCTDNDMAWNFDDEICMP